jgi:glycerate kinase
MKILVASDSFKGTLTSLEVGQIIESELRDDHNIDIVPVSDGGEGFLGSMRLVFPGDERTVRCPDPLGKEISCSYIISDGGIALIESAAACGLGLLADRDRNPMRAGTYGLGVLMRDALHQGVRTIYIGLGGSMTNDGGAGLMRALGVKLLDDEGKEILQEGGRVLKSIAELDLSGLDMRAKEARIIVIGDVDNPLLGERGATRVYGPQKGADAVMVEDLEAGMVRYAAVVSQKFGVDYSDDPGVGAAGGLGFCLRAFLGARIYRGIEAMIELAGLEERVRGYDLIITGEGKLDRQTGSGKVPLGILRLGERYRVPVICLCGVDESGGAYSFERVFPIVPGHGTMEESLAETGTRFRKLIREELIPWLHSKEDLFTIEEK